MSEGDPKNRDPAHPDDEDKTVENLPGPEQSEQAEPGPADDDPTVAGLPWDGATAGDETLDGTLPGPSGGAGGPARTTASTGLPERIGTYLILGELGRGGMGTVYLAADPVLERRIAIKVLPDALAADVEAFSRFRGEAKLLAAMNHPNIAVIHSLEEADGLHFLTMERIEGKSLSDGIRERSGSLDTWLAVARQIAAALEAAHRSGIVHLDLKPQNVMVTGDGHVKVLDFGLAMALGSESDDTEGVRTRSRAQESISGTPGYMSPEQVLGKPVDSRADIWSFGCILYECLGGAPAVPGRTIHERMRATLDAPIDLETLPADTPPRIKDLIARCLTREPEKRLDSITRARREIEAVVALRAVPQAEIPKSEAAPNNLPLQLSTFIGRDNEKRNLNTLLGEHRLVTLTGVGGGGKTRLAVEAAREVIAENPDGVWLVEFGPIGSGQQVPQTVANVLKLRDEGSRSPVDLLTDYLASRRTLLILDNCEHVLEAAAGLTSKLLGACASLRIMATSREALGLPGEVIFPVPSLSVPRAGRALTPEALLQSESVSLFTSRAKAVRPDFEVTRENAPAVAQICRRLDGIPLAIELAAARCKVLKPHDIADRLDDRFKLLGSSRRTDLPHHQTLRALIDWSYDHLTESEQAMLRRLSAFAGGWSLESAESVCGGDGIDEWEILDLVSLLVDKSLVEVDADAGRETDQARYRMLETIREYSRDRLRERDEGADVLVKHRDFFISMAEEAEPNLMGREQTQWLRRLSADHDNLRQALDICIVSDQESDAAWRLASALGRYWYIRGHWNEGRDSYRRLMESTTEVRPDSAAAAGALSWAGNLAKLQGDYEEARKYLEESLEIRRRLGDEAGIASSLNNLGNVVKDLRDLNTASQLYGESLEIQKRLGNRVGIALSLNSLAVVAYLQEEMQRSLQLNEEALALRRELGDRMGIATSLTNLGGVAEALGDYESATARFEESIALRRELGDRWGIAASLNGLGRAAESRGDLPHARESYEEAVETFRELGDRWGMAASLNNLGLVLLAQGEREPARRHLAEGLKVFCELGDCSAVPALLRALARIAESDDPPRAVQLLAAAEGLREGSGAQLFASDEKILEPLIQRLRNSLGDNEFQAAWSHGRSLDLREAADLGLGTAAGPPSVQ